jgi:hypothetical protein
MKGMLLGVCCGAFSLSTAGVFAFALWFGFIVN